MKNPLNARFVESLVERYVVAVCPLCSLVLCLLAFAGAGGLQAGTVYVKDPVATSGTGCYTIASLAGQTLTAEGGEWFHNRAC